MHILFEEALLYLGIDTICFLVLAGIVAPDFYQYRGAQQTLKDYRILTLQTHTRKGKEETMNGNQEEHNLVPWVRLQRLNTQLVPAINLAEEETCLLQVVSTPITPYPEEMHHLSSCTYCTQMTARYEHQPDGRTYFYCEKHWKKYHANTKLSYLQRRKKRRIETAYVDMQQHERSKCAFCKEKESVCKTLVYLVNRWKKRL
jgi:hypothetical protein